MSEPREFWIRETDAAYHVVDAQIFGLTANDGKVFKVIEKTYAEALKAELEAVKEERDTLDMLERRKTRDLERQADAIDRLTRANEILKEKVLDHKRHYGTDIFPNSK